MNIHERIYYVLSDLRERIYGALPDLRENSIAVGKTIAQFILGLLMFVMFWGLVLNVGLAFKGVQDCRDGFSSQHPQTSQTLVESNSFRGRTLDDHWISALVMQPKNLEYDEITVVCHFVGKTYKIGEIEVIEGDKTDRLKKVSVSNFNPKTWSIKDTADRIR